MSVGTPGDKTSEVKAALVKAARQCTEPLAADGHDLLVRYGLPSLKQLNNYHDIIAVTDTDTDIDDGPMSRSNRAEKHNVVVSVEISVWRPDDGDDDPEDYSSGGGDLEKEASDQAFALLRALEEYVRVTDKELGGTVLSCRCLRHNSRVERDARVLAKGRCVEIEAQFVALVRVTSH